MPTVEWALWCEYAFRSREHFISAIGIHDAAKVKLPAMIERGFLVFGVAGSSEQEVHVEVVHRTPEGRETGRVDVGRHQLAEGSTRDILVEVLRLPILTLGRHRLEILLDGTVAKSVGLTAVAE